ncbi:MAG: ABC transporter ATP-binding protein [Burkholderiaceae bacterium]
MTLFALEGVDVFYGKAQALHAVDLRVARGEIVSLVGRNGAGKTTILRAAMGLLPCARGRRVLEGADITGLPPHGASRCGVALVPADRQVFPTLDVVQNLRVAQVAHRTSRFGVDDAFELFPRLKERRRALGGSLSGGEQQMLSIARGLMTGPSLMLLDEATEGLAPIIVESLTQAIQGINRQGVSILLVEQNMRVPMRIAHRQYVIETGRVAWSGTLDEARQARERIETLISV